jgi:uncharacterized repeat protein (TIGR02543 family)
LQNPGRSGYTFEGWLPENTIAPGSTGDKIFTAQWSIIEGYYSITYDLGNGGKNHPDNPNAYTSTDAITLKDPSRTGYTFDGWLPGNTIAPGSTGDKTFTAQWSTTAYTIGYELDGGTNHADNHINYTVESATITLQNPSKSGYTFEGWSEGNTIEFGSTGDKSFTAQWLPTAYSIGYELNGGTNHADNPVNYTVESATISLQNPSKSGYTFDGWSEGNTIASGSTGDKSFIAQWLPTNYSISYELNGGTNHADNPATYTVESATISLQNPSKSGYTFDGWSEGNTIEFGSTGDKSFTAQWSTRVYEIKYELGGGTNHADNPASYTVETATVTLQDPTREGYDFAGWTEGEGKIVIGSTGNKTFTAQWTIVEGHYSIAYELGGGENHPDNPNTYTSTDAITLQDPDRPGYTFDGWAPENTIALGSTGDKTFTAQWTIIEGHYVITYELGSGGENHPDNPETYTSTDVITLKAPSRPGYTFDGWLPENTIVSGSTGDKTFTAQWSILEGHYVITYELGGGENHRSNPNTYTVEDETVLQNPDRPGYKFMGWAEGNTIERGSTGDRTFTAQWQCNEANILEITLDDDANISEKENGVFEYSLNVCDKTSLILNLTVSPEASVTVNGETYSPSGYEIVLNGESAVRLVNIRVVSETGDIIGEYILRIIPPVDGSLYHQRWSDVLAVNANPETNGGYIISGIRWYGQDDTPLGNSNYIEIRGSASDYYAEIETGGVWRRVCPATETRSLDKIEAYPNPVPRGEKLTLKLPKPYTGSVLNIYDIRGALVKSGQPLPAKVNSIDVSELASGIYLLRISGKQGKSETVKIIVE